MSHTYYQTNITSDLSVASANSNTDLANNTGAAATLDFEVDKGNNNPYANTIFYTDVDDPSDIGITGDYEVTLNVATGDADVNAEIYIARVNSSGTPQAQTAPAAWQTLTAGIKTFNFTGEDLGSWASGDRLRVWVQLFNNAAHGVASMSFGVNTVDEYVIAPWTFAGPFTYSQAILV